MSERTLHLPVMVSVDKRGTHDVMLPGASTRTFRGQSLAELLDDVALHLMETIPNMPVDALARHRLCPDIELRRVKTTARIGGTPRKPVEWTGRMTVVVTRWREDDFYLCTVPRMGTRTFAVTRTAHLEAGLARFIERWADDERAAGHPLDPDDLEPLTCRGYEYIEILEVETELPTVLPSRPPKRKKPEKKPRGVKKTRAERKAERQRRRLVPPATLRQVGVDLTHRAIDGRLGRTYGRDALVDDLLARLARPGAAVLLVGPPGVGKTALVYELVRRLAARNLPLHQRTDVWSVDGNRIIAGMSLVGAWEQRVAAMVAELDARQDILFVDDLPALVYTGRTSQADTHVAQFLEPHLARGELRIIGECTPERLEATREEAPGFFSRFHIVQVPELSERDTLMVLVDALRAVEAREAVRIEPEVLEGILALTRRFQRRQCHPGKAMVWLDRLVSDHHAVERDDLDRRVLDRPRLIDFFARRTGLPPFVLWEQQSRPFDEVLDHFTRRIIGQPAASHTAAEIVAVLQQGLDDPERPLATMLFVGPTGVGKTETAKALAEYLFGSADRLVRFDMSEFRDPWSMARLFGDRHQPEGELTRQVAQQPFSVVLFDEIEKAHPRVFDAFLQVFGEGRLTNAAGRTTDFCNTILVMTSNLGVREAARALGFTGVEGATEAAHYRKAAEGFFRPEFFNRIDRVVPFRTLTRDDLGPLIERILTRVLARRGLRRSGVMVEVEPELVELLVDEGFDPKYGARSLRRALEQRLTVPLARRLVGQPTDRATLVQLYRHGDAIGMDVFVLDEADAIRAITADGADAFEITSWPALRARVDAIRADLEGIVDADTLETRAAERTRLLAAFNAGALPPEGWARLTVLNGLLDPLAGSRTGGPAGVNDVRLALDAIAERFLADVDYIEDLDLVGPGTEMTKRSGRWTASSSIRAVGTERPMRRARRGLFKPAVAAVERLERDLAAVAFRLRALDAAEPELLVLRALPGTEEPGSWGWTRAIAEGLWRALRRWGDVRWAARGADGWLLAPTDPSGLPADPLWRDATGWALVVRGFGVSTLGPGEAGYHLALTHAGPDLVCSLARVDVISPDVTGDPIARLTADDAAYTAWRAARRRGDDQPTPRPPLAICRRFEQGAATDPETGVALTTRDLGGGISRVLDRRLLAMHRGRG